MRISPILLTLMSFSWQLNSADINVQSYVHMPPLYEIDSFDNCPRAAGRFENIIPDYCYISVEIDKSKSDKQAFNVIKEFSRNSKQFFQHGQLKRGICLSSCLELHEQMGSETNKFLNDDKSLMNHGGDEVQGMLNAINKIVNVCVNKDLNDTYDLMATSTVDFCIDRNRPTPYDTADYIFFGFFIGILTLIIISTIYQLFEHRPRVISVFSRFKRTKQLIVSFNVKQNWRKLLESDSNDLDCLTRFHASKFAIMFLFVFTQVYRHIASMPFANPIYVEQSYQQLWTQFLDVDLLNSIFFVVCGLQMSFELIPMIQKSTNNWTLLKAVVGTKYRKLTTLYTAFVLLNSIIDRLSNYPLWKVNSFKELHKCRQSWRLNMLSLNNYENHEKMCIEPSWILSAELHASLVGFIVLYLLVKFPRWKLVTSGIAISLSVGIVSALIYINNLAPVILTNPEFLRSGGDSSFAKLYYPSHVNFGHFLISLLFGFAIQSNFNFSKFMTKLNTFAFFGFFLFDYTLFRFLYMKQPIFGPLQRAWIGGYMKHRQGIFLPLLINELILKKKLTCDKIFTKIVMASDRILSSALVTGIAWLVFYINNSVHKWIELNCCIMIGLVSLTFLGTFSIVAFLTSKLFPDNDMFRIFNDGLLTTLIKKKSHFGNCCSKLLKVADKLFPSAFLSSLLVMKIILFRRDALILMNCNNLVFVSIITFVLSYLLAIVVFIVIEAPFVKTSAEDESAVQLAGKLTEEPKKPADESEEDHKKQE